LPFEQRLLNRLFEIKKIHTIGSLFTVVLFRRILRLKKKNLSQLKLFKPPVVQETLSDNVFINGSWLLF